MPHSLLLSSVTPALDPLACLPSVCPVLLSITDDEQSGTEVAAHLQTTSQPSLPWLPWCLAISFPGTVNANATRTAGSGTALLVLCLLACVLSQFLRKQY